MPLLRAEAEKLSRTSLERGIIEEIYTRDELFALFPFMPVVGKAYVYNRENTLSGGAFLDPYEDVPEGAATFIEITAKLRIIAGDVDLDKFLISTMGDTNDQTAIQLAAKAKALGRQFRDAMVNGDSNANAKSFDGIRVLSPSGQTITAGANGAALTLTALDELLDAVHLGPDVLMMRSGTWRAIRALLRTTGGMTPEMIQIDNFGKPVPSYNGVPVILNDYVKGDEVQGSNNATTSVYAMRLNELDGLHGIYGGGSAGFVLEEIGTLQTKDAYRYRMKWYVGTALKSTKSLARLKGVTNI
jgi:HK97 family phage major capsid protein